MYFFIIHISKILPIKIQFKKKYTPNTVGNYGLIVVKELMLSVTGLKDVNGYISYMLEQIICEKSISIYRTLYFRINDTSACTFRFNFGKTHTHI